MPKSREIEIRLFSHVGAGMSPAVPLPQLLESVANGSLKYDPLLMTAMLFTGKKDATQRKIFEGDVVEVDLRNEMGSCVTRRAQVMWWDDGACFTDFIPSDPSMPAPFGSPIARRVIGNIYENPGILSQPHASNS